MRRRISLYVGGVRADLADDGLVLLNAAITDLTNPTIVKNSYTHAFDLPRTPFNESIFGHSGRLDRNAGGGGTGPDFNASKKLPFNIYTAAGQIIVSGYCKLDKVTPTAFSVTLYGGLGDFIYGLSYDSSGEKRTLASLDYGEDLDFVIDKNAVADAWGMLADGYITVRPTSFMTSRNLRTDGATSSSSNANRQVNTYSVVSGKKYLICCRRVGSEGFSAAVAYDGGGVVVQTWFDGGSAESIVDYQITIPSNAVELKLQGQNTSRPAILKDSDTKWNVINFAPCYNGIPSDFNADKALIDTDLLGIVPPVTIDGKSCDATKGGGYALLTMPNAADEWMAHDLRSYLQRPVLSVRKFLDAIADPQNNGGWAVDISDLAGVGGLDTWLTRPLLPSLGTYKQTEGDIALTFDGTGSGQRVGRFSVADAPAGTEVTARMQFRPVFSVPGATQPTLYPRRPSGTPVRIASLLLFIQPIGYDSGNSPVAYGKVTTLCGDDYIDPAATASAVGYTPEGGAGFNGTEIDWTYTKVSNGVYKRFAPVSLEISGKNIDHIDIKQTAYAVVYLPGLGTIYAYTGTVGEAYASLFTAPDESGTAVACNAASGADGSGTGTQMASDTLRSGALVTKQMLLSTSKTPAEYLLALCKVFGLYIVADSASRSVQILTRNTFYNGGQTDLSGRVDKPSIEIQPLAFDAKWYDFKLDSVGGRFEKEYQETEGVQYGIKRVDTGYDFDADTKDLLQGAALKSCAAVRDRGVWWTYAYDAGAVRMWVGPVLTAGCKYTLWDADGANHEADAEAPTDTATAYPYNADFPGYDVGTRAEFRDAEGKPLDGADVLLMYTGAATPDDFNLTDDTAAMDTLVGGPCWLVETNNVGLTIPEFTRYAVAAGVVTDSLDFGTPRAVDIPGLEFPAGVDIYSRGWEQYIHDRLSVHGKVLRCKVLLDGLQFGPELFRRFYWYGGSLWVLNRISNYSLTTFDPAECEFVQVRDTAAYTGGQSY